MRASCATVLSCFISTKTTATRKLPTRLKRSSRSRSTLPASSIGRMPMNFLADSQPLRGEDAVAAIITVEDGRYLMQLRDDIPRIFYPGHWGCFGGAVSAGEDAL